jgi:hypothetical protein
LARLRREYPLWTIKVAGDRYSATRDLPVPRTIIAESLADLERKLTDRGRT